MSEKKSEPCLEKSLEDWDVLELEDAMLDVIRGAGLTNPGQTNRCDVNGQSCTVNPN